MKQLAIILLCLLSSCDNTVTGGRIIGKYLDHFENKTIAYKLKLISPDGQIGSVNVTEQAWNQAKENMNWPFEIK